MYTTINFRFKAQLKAMVEVDKVTTLTLYAPGLGKPKRDGWETVEGPHYPEPHTWYAQVLMKDGFITRVK